MQRRSPKPCRRRLFLGVRLKHEIAARAIILTVPSASCPHDAFGENPRLSNGFAVHVGNIARLLRTIAAHASNSCARPDRGQFVIVTCETAAPSAFMASSGDNPPTTRKTNPQLRGCPIYVAAAHLGSRFGHSLDHE